MVLSDELAELDSLIKSYNERRVCCNHMFAAALDSEILRIKETWRTAAFSRSSPESLLRYFGHHLKGICLLTDTLYYSTAPKDEIFNKLKMELLALMRYLKSQYPNFFDENQVAPKLYCSVLLGNLLVKATKLAECVIDADLDTGVKRCLLRHLDELPQIDSGVFTFRSLLYIDIWLDHLLLIDYNQAGVGQTLLSGLIQVNFNHLNCFTAIREQLSATFAVHHQNMLTYLLELKCLILSEPAMRGVVYHPDWPDLKDMLSGWLNEEIEHCKQHHPNLNGNNNQPKLVLNISVSQLACLIRQLSEQDIFAANNLTEIFKFFAAHFETKRQANLSPGSLRKEFYGIEQVTAAGVQGILQKMVSNLKVKFFPVLIVISTTVYALAGMR